MDTSEEETKRLIGEAPDYCLITGMYKCESYTIDGNVVYLPNPAYDAYTLPEMSQDGDETVFYHTKYDMDNDYLEESMFLCNLEDLMTHPRLKEIKEYFNIVQKEDIKGG